MVAVSSRELNMKRNLLMLRICAGALAVCQVQTTASAEHLAGPTNLVVVGQNKIFVPPVDAPSEPLPTKEVLYREEAPAKIQHSKDSVPKERTLEPAEPLPPVPTVVYDPAPPPTYAPYSTPVPKIFDILESTDGTTLHLVGVIDAGIANALRLKLQSKPGAKTLVLSSSGGSIIEGLALAHLVTQYGLNTHVEYVCASACTFPFLSGKTRTISKDAGLGFHQASGAGFYNAAGVKTHAGGNELMREFYRRANLDPEMIDKAINTEPDNFWFPDTKLLKSGQAVDIITSPGSVSFPTGIWGSVDAVNAITSKDGYWKKLQGNRPSYYHLAVSELWTSGILSGNIREGESKSLIALKKLFLTDFASYSDDLVDEAITLEDKLWPSYSNSDYLKCKYVGGVSIPVGAPITDEQKKQQSALLAKMASIEVAEGRPNEAALINAQAAVFSFLGLMVAETDHNNYVVKTNFCSMPSDYYRILMLLPSAQRVYYFKALTLPQVTVPFY